MAGNSGVNLASIGLRIDGSGAIDVLIRFDRAAGNAGRSGDRLERTARNLRAALAAVGASLGARELIEYADSWRLIEGRIGLATSTTRMATTVQEELFAAAQRSRAAFEGVAGLYAKVARNAGQLNASQRDVLDFTETVSKGFITSGASVSEMNNAILQLGQGLASGRLQGDELRSILENAPRLANAIATGMGVTVGQLRKLGSEGKLTAKEIFDAVMSQRQAIESEFQRMPVTIGQSLTVLNNELRRFVGESDKATGASVAIGGAINFLANNFNDVVEVLGIVVIAWTSYAVAVKAAVAYTLLLPLAQTIAAYVSLALQVRTAAAAMALFSMAARDAWRALTGPVGIAMALATAVLGFIAYRRAADAARQSTDEFRSSLVGMSKAQLMATEADLDRQIWEQERLISQTQRFREVTRADPERLGASGLPMRRRVQEETPEYRQAVEDLATLRANQAALEERKEAMAELEVRVQGVTTATEDMSRKSRRAMAEFRAGLAEMIREAEHARDTSTLQGMAQDEANERFAAANALLRMRADLTEKVISETLSQGQADTLYAEAQRDVARALGLRLEANERVAVAEARRGREEALSGAQRDIDLTFRYGDAQERLRIHYDAVNRAAEARSNLQGEALEITLATIAAEERLGREMVTVERLAGEAAQGINDTINRVFDGTIRTLGDLFGWIKQAFTRMLAEMATDRMMAEIGKALQREIYGGALGRAQSANAGLQATVASLFAAPSIADKASGNIQMEGITATATTGAARNQEMLKKFAGYLGAAMAGASLGQMFGYSSGSAIVGALGGGLSGAASGFMMAGPAGAVVGGLAGLASGILGAAAKRREEERLLRETLDRNNQRLEVLRESFDGFNIMSGRNLVAAGVLTSGVDVTKMLSGFTGRVIAGRLGGVSTQDLATALKGGESTPQLRRMEEQFGVTFQQLGRIAKELGIELYDSAGKLIPNALRQLNEAIELTIRAATQFGNNLDDIRLRQEARNALFDLNGPDQKLKDAYEQLTALAPDLLKQMGLANLNLDTDAGRKVLLEGLRDIFRMIEAGQLTPELLGAFSDKGQLIDAILRAKAGLDAFNQSLGNVTTDFPKAMDLIIYEQRFGRGVGVGGDGQHPSMPPPRPPDTNPGGAGRPQQPMVKVERLVVYYGRNDSPEDAGDNINRALAAAVRRGGMVVGDLAASEPVV